MLKDFGSGLFMVWGYIVENNTEEVHDNQALFKLIAEMEVADDNLYFDMLGNEKTELQLLLDSISNEDVLIIRSVEDLGNSIEEVKDVFNVLQDMGISLCSCQEPYFSGNHYLKTFEGFLNLIKYFSEKKKQLAYQKAVEEGRVGRPAKESEIKKAVELYKSGKLTVEQITALTKISKSTLYRHIE